jgi:hypothetical protein
VETFFRRWFLFLVPFVLLLALGVQSVATAKKEYVSKGVLYVESETLLSKLTGTDPAPNNGFETPAQAANTRLSSLLGTDEFIRSIVDRAGLTDAVNGGLLTLGGVRSSIGTTPSSPNTLHVGGQHADPQIAFRLATATIDSFIQWVIDRSLTDSAAAEKFFQEQATTYKVDRDTTQAALQQWLKVHLEPLVGTRPAGDEIELSRLQAEANAAEKRYTDTLGKADDARLASAQTRSNVAGRLRLVDAPKVSAVSTLTKKKLVIQFAMFMFLGLALSGAAVFVGTVTDKSFRSPEEIRERLGVPLLAVIPESRQPRVRRRGRRGADPVAAASNGRLQARVDESVNAASQGLEVHHADL